MSEKFIDELPQRRRYDHRIPLRDGREPPFEPFFGILWEELKFLKDYIQENLENFFIRDSSSTAGAPTIFVKNYDGTLLVCVDHRVLNELTIKIATRSCQ